MKKLLLLLFCTAIIQYSFAFTTQGKWRWRKDDGTETTATYLAAENTTPTISTSDNIRLRTEIYNSTTDNHDISSTTLAYSLTGADNTWILISDTVANHDFVLVKSSFVTNLEATTQQLTALTGYTFVPGVLIDTVSTYPYTLTPNQSTEFEWVIKPTSTVQLNTTYYFENSVLGYDQPLPTLKIASTLAVNLMNFSLQQQSNKVLISWSTSSENNNDHFEVLRSADSKTWQTIATVKAIGSNSSQKINYSVNDNNPLNGTNYYRVKQYDKDGTSTLYAIKALKINSDKILASVFPNPAKDFVNIQLQNYSGNVSVSLINSKGTTISSQTFNASSNISYKFNLITKAPPGIYYLLLTGNKLNQKIKVVIE